MKAKTALAIMLVLMVSSVHATECTDYGNDGGLAGLFLPTGDAVDVTARGDLAFVLGNNFSVVDISQPSSPVEVASLSLGSTLDQLALSGDLICVSSAFSSSIRFIDITDPSAPILLGSFQTDHNVVALDVQGEYAYAIGGFLMDLNFFQVIDLGDPSDPHVLSEIQTMCINGMGGVAADGDHVYITNPSQGLGVVDVSDPTQPVVSWTDLASMPCSIDTDGSIVCVGADSDMGPGGHLHVLDIQDPAAPVLLASLSLPSVVRDIAISGSTAYCGLDGGMAVVSLDDPAVPELIGVVEQGQCTGVFASEDLVLFSIDHSGLGIGYLQCHRASGVHSLLPSKLELLSIAPNPFNPNTTATFRVQEPQTLSVSVYDVQGNLVRELASGWYDAGEHRIPWNGMDGQQRRAPSGTYFFRLTGSSVSTVQAVTLVK